MWKSLLPGTIGAVALGVLLTAPTVQARAVGNCHVGSYRLTDGRLVDISPDDGDTLQWQQFDGETGVLHKGADGAWMSTYGWTDHADGKTVRFSACGARRIDFAGVSGRQIAFDVRTSTFTSHGTRLVGRLILPKGTNRVAVVVFVHGSENASALDTWALQRILPAEGVGMFVYDKRGTGKSGGVYTQDFNLLADDAVAAVHEARHLAGARLSRIGYHGTSQGGWVAPIAANRAAVDFVIVAYGLAVSVIAEDQEAVELQLGEKGYSATDIADALTVAKAAEAVFVSDFKSGIDEFDAVRSRYRSKPWFKDVQGDFIFLVLPQSKSQLRAMGPKFDWHTPFNYDPMPTLRAGKVPQLWVLGGEDYQAPSAETRRRLDSLIAQRHPFTVAYYPKAQHGIMLFETEADGSRVPTRIAPGYFRMIRDFARDGRLRGSYGDAELTPPAASGH
ncbi:MAG TPA: alpha/beta hydrolase [Steroidobacteraceae bacterium]|nr:alpha/beta hydrolase [Steroidobacteraceae bacterium]